MKIVLPIVLVLQMALATHIPANLNLRAPNQRSLSDKPLHKQEFEPNPY